MTSRHELAPNLSYAIADDGTAATLSLWGEIDLLNAGALVRCLEALGALHRRLKISLAGVTFIDLQGLQSLLRLRAAHPGCAFVVQDPPPSFDTLAAVFGDLLRDVAVRRR